MPVQEFPASSAVLAGQDFYRIFDPEVLPGVIYELDTSVRAIAIGAESDIPAVRIAWQDPGTNQAVTARAAVNAPLIGRIDALDTGPLLVAPPTAGRILLYPDVIITTEDIVDTFVADGEAAARAQILAPRLDIIAYLVDPPAFARSRAPRTFLARGNVPNEGVPLTSFYGIPFYGRSECSVTCWTLNDSWTGAPNGNFTISTFGLHGSMPTQIDQVPTADFADQCIDLVPLDASVMDFNTKMQFTVDRATHGAFDFIVVFIGAFDVGLGVDPSRVAPPDLMVKLETRD